MRERKTIISITSEDLQPILDSLLTPGDLEKRYGKTQSGVYAWYMKGGLPSVIVNSGKSNKLGSGARRFIASEVEAWAKEKGHVPVGATATVKAAAKSATAAKASDKSASRTKAKPGPAETVRKAAAKSDAAVKTAIAKTEAKPVSKANSAKPAKTVEKPGRKLAAPKPRELVKEDTSAATKPAEKTPTAEKTASATAAVTSAPPIGDGLDIPAHFDRRPKAVEKSAS